MASDYKLAIKIMGDVDGSLDAAVKDAQSMLDQLNGGVKKNGIGQTIAKGIGKGIWTGAKAIIATSAASLAAMGVTTGKVVKDSIAKGMSYEEATSQLAATMGVDKSNADFLMLDDTIQALGKSTNFTATEVAEAANILAMAGYTPEQNMAALATTLHLAGAGALDMESAASYLTGTLATMGIDKTEENFQHVADVMAKVATLAKTDVAGIGEAMTTVGATASQLPGGVEEVAALAGALANVNIYGSEAGTHIRNLIMSLQNARSDDAAAWFDELGVNAFDAEGNMRSIMDIMGDLSTSMEGWTTQQKSAALSDMFKLTDQASVNALLGILEQSGEEYNNLYDAALHASDGMGAAAQMYSTQTDNLQGDIDIMKSATEGLNITLYQSMVEGLRGTVQEVTDLITGLDEAFKLDGLKGLAEQIGTDIGEISEKIAESGPQAIEDATQFATDIINSIGSEEHATEIGGAAASIITSLGENFLTYTGEFAKASGNLLKGLIDGFNSEDMPYKWSDAIGNLATTLGDAFTANPAEFGTAAGNLLSSLAMGIASNSGKLLSGGIKIVQGLAQGIVQAGFILISHAPEIINDLLHGILDDGVPALFDAGKALAMSMKDGIVSLGSDIWSAFTSAMNMESEHLEMDDIFDSATLDAYGENIQAVNDKMIDLVTTTGNYSLTGLQAELLEGTTSLDEALSQIGELDPESVEYADMAADLQGYVSLMHAAMDELGISYEQVEEILSGTEEVSGEVVDGISQETQSLVDSILDSENGLKTGSEAMMQEFEDLANSAEETGNTMSTALSSDVSAMDSDALSVLLQSIDTGNIDGVVEQLNTSMEQIRTTVDTASTGAQTSMQTAMTGIQTAVSTASMAVSLNMSMMAMAVSTQGLLAVFSANMTAAGITGAFSGMDLYSIAASAMDGLINGINERGAAAVAAAQSIASQIAGAMAGALQIHSPSRVTYAIGENVGLGLENALYDQRQGVYSASQALANNVAMGTNDSMSAPLRAFNSPAGMGAESSADAAGGNVGGITFSPQIIIQGNASENDVKNALGWSMSELEKMIDRIMANKRRTAFA